ncbi:uncharacterized protein BKCO1_7000222 [Diplodia corticola]|uniref:Uncharacterized protein n=1 Tax=Diplodia corticola TaxID=236234 RepID=A0A1J9RXM0_9PEZI|nr:uncharacterized protein BKCO1_7000222 [Diplodia corticola]OJD37403.1 hypothetical protein BKCO1_7000222 [Diplodia corticola]
MSLYTPNGYCALLVTANDTTKPALRPTYLDQSDPSSGTDAQWALIGRYSIAGAGPYRLSNVTAVAGNGTAGSDDEEGPQGTVTGEFLTATLPSREGPFEFTFRFYEGCGVWNLHQSVGEDAERVAWYERLPDRDVYG